MFSPHTNKTSLYHNCYFKVGTYLRLGFPGGAVVKNPHANARDASSVPGSGRSPGDGNGNPLQYACWEIPWTEEPQGLQSRGHKKLDMTEVT